MSDFKDFGLPAEHDSNLNDFVFDLCVLDSHRCSILNLPIRCFELMAICETLLRDTSSDILITVKRHGD